AVHAAPARGQGHTKRNQNCGWWRQGPHRRQNERTARAGNHRRPVRGIAGRREDRSPGAWRMCIETRYFRRLGKYTCAFRPGAIPGTYPGLLLLQRRRRRRLSVERGLDGPKFFPSHRSVLSGAGFTFEETRDTRGTEAV